MRMPDVWATVATQDDSTQDRLADVLELRGSDPQQQELRIGFLASLGGLPPDARVVDVGCGTGVLTRLLASQRRIAEVVGVDVAPSLLERARALAAGADGVTFVEGDARALPFADASFDGAVFDSTLSHVAEPGRAVGEAFRVLRPGGLLAVFDGDYSTTTVALGVHDPLQACVAAMLASSVTDAWVMRRLPALARAAGFEDVELRSHGFVDTGGGAYVLSIVDRGADVLAAAGEIGADTAAALKAEARRRAVAGAFFGHIAYAALTGRRPDQSRSR
jgi:ubiquinone/menaquinone biosynthesis C-methylase UbiE